MMNKLFSFKEKVILFVTCFLSVLLMVWAVTLSFSLDESFNAHLKDIYGNWQNGIISTNNETITKIRNLDYLQEIGIQKVAAEVVSNGTAIGNIGSMDESFIEMANIVVKEGRLPVSSSEVAVEEILLDALQIDKIINQTVALTLSNNGEIYIKEYTLVGIIENYSLNWVNSNVLVNCISTDFDEYKCVNGYMTWENGAENSTESIAISSGSLITNTHFEMSLKNTYNYLGVLVPLLCIMFLMSYILILNHIKTRQKEYCIFLACGANLKELTRLLLNHILKITFIACCLSVFCHIPLSYLSVRYLEMYFEYPVYLKFPAAQLLLIVLVIITIVVVSVIFSSLYIKKLDITNFKGNSISEENMKPVFRLPQPYFFIRNILTYRKKFGLMLFMSIFSLFLCFISLHLVFYNQRAYQTIVNSTNSDYQVRLFDTNAYGYTENKISRISKISGIEAVHSYRNENQTITFENIENSDYFKNLSINGELSVSVLGIDDSDNQSFLEIEKLITEGSIDVDSLRNGNAAILVLPIFSCDNNICKVTIDRSMPIFKNDVYETNINLNDTIMLTSADGKESTLVVSGIIRTIPLSLYEKYGSFMVIASNSIFENKNPNTIYITASDDSTEVTDLLVAKEIGTSSGTDFVNQRIVKQQLSDTYVNSYMYSIIILSISLLIEVIVFYALLEKVFFFLRYQRNILYLLGLDNSKEKKIYLYSFLYLLIFVGLFVSFLFLQYEFVNYATVLQRENESIFDCLAYKEIISCFALWIIVHYLILKHQYNNMKKTGEKLNENFLRRR